jgi:RNA polymerase sigma factor (sigma-70 family)
MASQALGMRHLVPEYRFARERLQAGLQWAGYPAPLPAETARITPMAAPNRFTTTRWPLVLAAKRRNDPAGSEAFARLCERYYEPLYSYLRRRGQTPEDAQELTQGFMARLSEKELLRHADPARGKFRAFLLTSLKHYAANEHVRASAAKRGGAHSFLSLDLAAAEDRYRNEPRDDLTPERLYERQWALAVLERALDELRAEFRANGRETFYDAVHESLMGESNAASYRTIAERFGTSESAVKVSVHRMRRRYRELVRAEVAGTVESDDAVDDELRYLQTALRRGHRA